jgi:hypothetical protein
MCFEPFARARFKLAEALKSASMFALEVGSTCSYPDAREQDEQVVERRVVICDGVRSTPGEAVWQLANTALIYLVADRARAGSGLLMLAVEDLEQHLAELVERGIPAAQIDTARGVVRKAIVSDPDGNTITFFENANSEN